MPPAVGRLFVDSDETAPGANPVAVLSFDYWKTHLAEAPVAGQDAAGEWNARSRSRESQRPGFHSMVWGHAPDVFVPLSMEQVLTPEWMYLNDRNPTGSHVAGRLKPGVTRVSRRRLRSIRCFGAAGRRVQATCRSVGESTARLYQGCAPAFRGGSEGLQSDARATCRPRSPSFWQWCCW